MRQLLIATGNAHKLTEMRAILHGLETQVLGLRDVGIDELPEETGNTFEENAALKAEFCAEYTGLLSLADDSGIEVDALGGEPGIRSNRWAGPEATDAQKVTMLLSRMSGVHGAGRTARFVSAVAIAQPGGGTYTFRGTLEGMLAESPAGQHGFGYDPVLYVPELERTVAELSPDEKNLRSHRAQALRAALPTLRALLLKPEV